MTEVVEKTEHHDPEVLLLVERRTTPEGEQLALYTLCGILVLLRENNVCLMRCLGGTHRCSNWTVLLEEETQTIV